MRINPRFTTLAMAAAFGVILAGGTVLAAPRVSPEEMQDRDALLREPFNAADIPYSFVYDGKPSVEWFRTESEKPTLKGTEKKLDDVRTQYTCTWTEPKTGLVVRCVTVAYSDFPVIESTLTFKNTGKRDTPILKDIKALDLRLDVPDGKAVLHYNRGTTVQATDFQPLTAELAVGKPLTLTSNQGRPCGGIWPYFNLQCGDKGRIIVVGWPGKWAATFDHQTDKEVRVTAGQELVNLKLHPGEEIRTPLIVQMFYRGDVVRAQNVWRRWMIATICRGPAANCPRRK